MAYASSKNRFAVARFAAGILRALSTTVAGRDGLRSLTTKTPDQLEDIGLTFADMGRLTQRNVM